MPTELTSPIGIGATSYTLDRVVLNYPEATLEVSLSYYDADGGYIVGRSFRATFAEAGIEGELLTVHAAILSYLTSIGAIN